LLQRLARALFGGEVPVEAHAYHYWRQREPREAAAWVSDLGFEPRFDKPNWVIIDHHPIEAAPRFARLIHHANKSAGLLCYELCQAQGLGSPQLDRLVHLNNVADLCLDEDPDFVVASDYANLVKTYGFWNLHALIGGQLERLLDHPLLEVMAVKRRVEDPLGLDWARKNIQPLAPQVGFVETLVGNTNLIVHQLLQQQATSYSVLVTLSRRSNGLIVASLRSRNGQALQVAEKLQGGGHPNAAGAALPRSIRTIPEAVDYLRKVLDPGAEQAQPLGSLAEAFDAAIAAKADSGPEAPSAGEDSTAP